LDSPLDNREAEIIKFRRKNWCLKGKRKKVRGDRRVRISFTSAFK
jgi:hypothetical protein